VLLHEFGQDLVLALEFGLEGFNLADVGVFDGLGLAAVVEGEVAVLEELALPLVEESGVETGTPSSRWRLTMATFSWGVK
jgi:hypothetical protein